GQAIQQARMAVCADFGVAKFAVVGIADLAAQLLRHGLHAVADAQHRHAQLEHRGWHWQRAFGVRGCVAAGPDDALQALRRLCPHERIVYVTGVDFGIDAGLAHAAGDQLGDLRTVVKNENALVVHEDSAGLEIKAHRPEPLGSAGARWIALYLVAVRISRRGSWALPW